MGARTAGLGDGWRGVGWAAGGKAGEGHAASPVVAFALVTAECVLRVTHYSYSPVKIVTGMVNDDRNFLAFGWGSEQFLSGRSR